MSEKKMGKIPLIWLLIGAVLFLFLIGLVVEGVLSFRGISATRASLGELGTKVEEVAAQTERLETELEKASAERAQLKEVLEAEISGELEKLEAKTSSELGELEKKVAIQEERVTGLQLQVLLLKASGKALKARIHLAEKEAGLAKRDLKECDSALEAAMASADEETKTSLKELRASMTELTEGIEAETFPLATLEILIDRIEALIGP
jgi:septal ring factor EnvC (AmiA/AmiB activator)